MQVYVTRLTLDQCIGPFVVNRVTSKEYHITKCVVILWNILSKTKKKAYQKNDDTVTHSVSLTANRAQSGERES